MFETDTYAVMSSDKDGLLGRYQLGSDQFIVLRHTHRDNPALCRITESFERRLLHLAFARRHENRDVRIEILHREQHANLLLGREIRQVDDGFAFPGAADVRNLIDLQPVELATIREDQHVAMRVGDEDVRDRILVPRLHSNPTFAAAALVAIDGRRSSLEITAVRDRDHNVFLSNQIFDIDFRFFIDDLGATFVTMLLLSIPQFFHDDLPELRVAGEDFIQFGDLFAEFLQLVLDLLTLETCQALQLHLEDRLRLDLREFELPNQAFASLRGRLGCANELDDGVDMIQGFRETFQDVRARFRLPQFILCSAPYHINAVFDE